ncbi:MAG: hypothetical protein QF792_01870 [Phycisphaerae bacterium]|jgi:hypothetical protein|nr:hypothetical protein [Phycisphaerae bacterium]
MSASSGRHPAHRRFGWAGFLLEVPQSYRLVQVAENGRRGKLSLADDERVRLELAWDTAVRRRMDPQRVARRCLFRATGKRLKRSHRDKIEPISLPALTCMFRYRHEETRCDHYAGFSARTNRFVRLACHLGDDDKNDQSQLFERQILPSLQDQPPDRPQAWAFFGVQFNAPAGLVYEESRLNLGDMRVMFVASDRRSRLTIGCIYPAKLALSRQPLDQWMRQILKAEHKRFRRCGEGNFSEIAAPCGRGLDAESHLRWVLLLWPWRRMRVRQTWLIHDAGSDRLVLLQATGRREELQALLDQAAKGLCGKDISC